jgi:hypothetical protein
MKPQPSSADTLRRVIKIARFDGLSVLILSGLCTLGAIALGAWGSIGTGLLITAAGWSEWHGAKLLQRGRARGIGWLVRSQLYLLSIILLYVIGKMTSFDLDPENVRLHIQQMNPLFAQFTGRTIQEYLEDVGLTVQDVPRLARTFFYAAFGTVALVTLIYQGGLALYYRRRTEAVYAALDKTHLPK